MHLFTNQVSFAARREHHRGLLFELSQTFEMATTTSAYPLVPRVCVAWGQYMRVDEAFAMQCVWECLRYFFLVCYQRHDTIWRCISGFSVLNSLLIFYYRTNALTKVNHIAFTIHSQNHHDHRFRAGIYRHLYRPQRLTLDGKRKQQRRVRCERQSAGACTTN